MTNSIVQQLTGPGAPFEFEGATINGMECRLFKNTDPCLTSAYRVLDEFADRDLVVYEGRRLTYQEAKQRAAALASLLQESFSIENNSRVAIAMRNSPEWIVSFLAVTSLGAIPALVNSRGTAEEISYCVESTHCELLLTDIKTSKGIDGTASGKLPRITFDLTQDFTRAEESSPIPFNPDSDNLPSVQSEPDDVAMILFTSGTTGRPKGALLTHRGVMTALKTNQFSGAIIGAQMAAKLGIDLQTLMAHRPQPATLLMFPLFHVSGVQAVFLTGMMQGGKVVMMQRWNAENALSLVEQEKVSLFPGVPLMYWDMVKSPKVDQFDLSSLTNVSVSGQSTPLSLFEAIRKHFPNALIGCGYGMTETNGAISLILGDELLANPTSVGHPVATTEIKLVDETGNEVTKGDRGEICVRGATVMKGYSDNPEANAKSFIDGWYKTGDIGQFDDEGRLYIVDRSTEMIISGGENIYCAEVERVLNQAEDVLEAVTFGLPDDRLGEKLVALVRTDAGSSQTEESIHAFAASKLASYKVPVEMFLVNEPLPTNPTGKVLKKEARKIFEHLADNKV